MTKKAKKLRKVSLLLLIVFTYQMVFPTAALALTGGPSQPEFTGFRPIEATNMVNTFSGDFSYNLPLMEVPGPNGSYPINLAYNAGIGLEQEASWVGLGWDLNIGSVNRSMRGLPDDFNGDEVKKLFFTKSRWNVGLSVGGLGAEFLNFDFLKGAKTQIKGGLYYDSYKGAGMSLAFDPSFTVFKVLEGSLSLGFDSNTGLSFSPSLSIWSSADASSKRFKIGAKANFHSIQGLRDVGFVYGDYSESSLTSRCKDDNIKTTDPSSSSNGAFVSFAKGAYVPDVNAAMRGINVGVAVKAGVAGGLFAGKPALGGNFSDTWVPKSSQDKDFKAYGYMYAHNRDKNHDLADFTRDHNQAITKEGAHLAIPNFTYDAYNVSGQGVNSAFRAHRSDFGVLSDPEVESSNGGGDITLEPAAGTEVKLGGDINVTFGKSQSGPWKNDESFRESFDFHGDLSYLDNLTGGEKPDQYQKYEPYYFKSAGDLAATESDTWDKIQGDKPVALRIGGRSNGFAFTPQISNYFKFQDNPYQSEQYQPPIGGFREKRERRSNHLLTRTIGDLGGNSAQTRSKHIVQANSFPRDGDAVMSKYDYKNDINSQIGSLQTITTDGYQYNYDIPVYNVLQKDMVFAIDAPYSNELIDNARVTYSSQDVQADNDLGKDEFFSGTILPKYAHAHLLTRIVSPDYVDLTGDGPTDDDFGFWVKFNYTKHTTDGNEYEWRHPYQDANYAPGFISDDEDDKATYTYGKKEIYYLNSVETKTHIAEFTLRSGNRLDALGAKGEHGDGVAKTLKSLEKVTLYSKLDPNYISGTPEPIKTVHFTHDYSLCKNALNSSSGKLTLKELYTTYGNSNKGSLSPYRFVYENQGFGSEQNPDYGLSKTDRWGNYKSFGSNANDYGNHINNPYVNQYADYNGDGVVNDADSKARSNHASAWNLRSVELPSGGQINIEYESDDYAYVQDKKAMDMMKITGISAPTGTYIPDDSPKIYFEPHQSSGVTVSSIAKYYEGLANKNVYFKTYLDLKKKHFNPIMSSDYVDGYAKIEAGGYDAASGKGWVQFKDVKKFDGAQTFVNPITKAGWQYMKLKRADLFDNPPPTVSIGIDLIIPAVWKLLKSAMQLLVGYYNYCDINKYCRELNLSDIYTSFIRLEDNDGIKYGGGHRVKSLTVNDGWNSMTGEDDFTYGQEYEYHLTDGISSGVAAYEPMVGSEENAVRNAIRYNSDELVHDDEQFYQETPIAEGFYPSASVGYSRVIVKNIMRDEEKDLTNNGEHLNKGSGGSATVSEYYTAKDFPVLTDETGFATDMIFKQFDFIPFVGIAYFDNRGYSQGYSVTLNDMNGKPKSVTTYKHGVDYDDSKAPYSYRQVFSYHTQGEGTNRTNRVISQVPVLFGENIVEMADLGKSMDFYMDMRNNYTYSESIGAQIDFHMFQLGAIPIPWFTGIPFQNYQEKTFSSIATNKVIFKSGILKSVKTYNDGVSTTVENLYYDSETGRPLVKKLSNEFKDDLYTMEIPAHWYNNYGGIYKNIGANLVVSIANSVPSSNEVAFDDVIDHREYFIAGDQLKIAGSINYWVDEVKSSYIKIKDETNSYANPNSNVSIYNSGYQNRLSSTLGGLMSKKDPVKDRIMPAFTVFNKEIEDFDDNYPGLPIPAILNASAQDCEDNVWNLTLSLNPISTSGTGFSCIAQTEEGVIYARASKAYPDGSLERCGFKIRIINKKYLDDNPITNLSLQFARSGDRLIITSLDQTKRYSALIDYCGDTETTLGPGCLGDVIHASAASVSDDGFDYNYEDLLDFNRNKITTSYLDPSSSSENPYNVGAKGNFRTDVAFVYKTARMSGHPTSEQKLSKDGVLDNFMFYDHAHNDNIGSNWIRSEEITLFDPYGNSLEAKDAQGIYSTTMMGYGNSLVTASAANAEYGQIAFESFEQHQAPVYDNVGIGHIQLIASNGATVSIANEGHTGTQSLEFTGTLSYIPASMSSLDFYPHSTYRAYAWIKGDGQLQISSGGTVSNSTIISENIDGWNLHYVFFKTPPSPDISTFSILFNDATPATPSFLDDLKMQPSSSSMETYVYDRKSFRLLAKLDDRNFSERYVYDEENNLIKINQETERGVITLKESRSNVKR